MATNTDSGARMCVELRTLGRIDKGARLFDALAERGLEGWSRACAVNVPIAL
jgi:hypothetical protein